MKSAALIMVFLVSISFGYSQSKDSLIAPWWVEKFKLTAGLFVPINNTKIQVEASGSAAGTDIDFQKLLDELKDFYKIFASTSGIEFKVNINQQEL